MSRPTMMPQFATMIGIPCSIRVAWFACAILFALPTFAQIQNAAGGQSPELQSPAVNSAQAEVMLAELRRIRILLEKKSPDPVLTELRLLRQTIERQSSALATPQPAGANTPAPTHNARLDVSGLPILGRPNAPLTMIEFTDYECPFCRAFHAGTFEQIKTRWIDSGKLRFISWDLPLEFHAQADQAAQAARCAGDQGRFWEMRSLLIAHADHLNSEDILGYAALIPQLMPAAFNACINMKKYAESVQDAAKQANGQGVSGTPTLVIAKTNGDVVDGSVLVGAQPYSVYEARMNAILGNGR